MVAWIITSSILIVLIILLRYLLNGRISPILQYALWLVVLLRLLIPFTPIASSYSILNLFPSATSSESQSTDVPPLTIYTPSKPALNSTAELPPQITTPTTPISAIETEEDSDPVSTPFPETKPTLSISTILILIWMLGIVSVLAYTCRSNIRFARYLRRTRHPLSPKYPNIFYVAGLPSSCLFGLLKPTVYISEDAAFDPSAARHVLAHELSHRRHGDTIWSLLRILALSLHWYNPLVWIACILSKQDAELAADAAAIRKLHSQERFDYGETLINTIVNQQRNALFICSTSMFGTKRAMRERIKAIVKNTRTKTWMIIAVLLLSLGLASCTFTNVAVHPTYPLKLSSTIADSDRILADNEDFELFISYYQNTHDLFFPSQSKPEETPVVFTDSIENISKQNVRSIESNYVTDLYMGNHFYIDENGTLWGTGPNSNSQLGADDWSISSQYEEPVWIADNVIHIDFGYLYTIYITEDHDLYGLGLNTYGVLREPLVEYEMEHPQKHPVPDPVLLMEDVLFASAGSTSISVLTEDHEVYWWGKFQATTGTYGFGNYMISLSPKLMVTDAVYTVCSRDTAAAIDSSGRLWLWGCNVWGQCGEDSSDYIEEPINPFTDVEMVWVTKLTSRQNVHEHPLDPFNMPKFPSGKYQTYVRKTDGNYYACGIDLGTSSKKVQYYSDATYPAIDPEIYTHNYSVDLVPIEIQDLNQEVD